jgi:hypothetical protein
MGECCALGTICKLAARLWPRVGLWCFMPMSFRTGWSSTVVAEPIDTIERDLLWERPVPLCDSVAVPAEGHCTEPERLRELEGGMLNDKADLLCPRPEEAFGGERAAPAFALDCSDDVRRVLSESGGCCGLGWSGPAAMFLKVIVHLISSPANTVWLCQRTKTRMLLGSSDGAMMPIGVEAMRIGSIWVRLDETRCWAKAGWV